MKQLRLILLPFSWLYWLAVKFRNLLFDSGIAHGFQFDIPLVCVGNITIGGTGKTPHTDYLLNLLKPSNRIALLSRGYGRKTKGFRIVEVNSTSEEVGDEPLQLKLRHPDVTCAVHEDRVNGVIELLSANPQLEAIVLDDAFQHRWIIPGLNILMMDYHRPVYSDFMLPAGNLRDNISEIRRAQIIIVSKCPEHLPKQKQENICKRLKIYPNQTLYFTTVRYGHPKNISESSTELILSKSNKVFALSGIANPKPFVGYLTSKISLIGQKVYRDHHNFSIKEILSIFETLSKTHGNDFVIVTTEKDAARIRTLALPQLVRNKIFYLPLEIVFLNNESERFNSQILSYVRENKSNSNLH